MTTPELFVRFRIELSWSYSPLSLGTELKLKGCNCELWSRRVNSLLDFFSVLNWVTGDVCSPVSLLTVGGFGFFSCVLELFLG